MVNKIFIIDDDPINTFIVKQMATKLNMAKEYIIFNNSVTALQNLLELSESNFPDLVFIDINMPIHDGWDIVMQLEEKRSQIDPFIIFLTSSTSTEDRL